MFTVYSKNNCSYCNMAKTLLTQKKISYQEFNIEEDPSKRAQLLKMAPNIRTLPQIFDDQNQHIGGFIELKSYLG